MIEVSTVRRRLLGAELRRLREAGGFSLDDAARILECDRSKVSRIETGHRGMRPKELRELLAEYGVEEERRYVLADLARQAGKRGWWQEFSAVLPAPYQELMGLEACAAAVDVFDSQAIPGLLRSEAYARCVYAADLNTQAAREQDQLVTALRARQQVLIREPTPLRVRVIVGEAAVRQTIGVVDVMRDQLNRLIDLDSGCPNVTLQVLPFNVYGYACVYGPFEVLDFPKPAQLGLVHLDNLTGGLFLEAPEEVEDYRRAFEHLSAAALPLDRSISFIEKAANEL